MIDQAAVAGVGTRGWVAVPDSALARITLATTHIIIGERNAATLTTAVLDAVSDLRSTRNRAMLAPLAKALSARKDSTSVELAQRAQALRDAA